MNILIIEDDKLTLHALKQSLEDMGHTLSVATNGEEGINMAADGKFDLLLCDIMMPGISGLSLVTILRCVHLCHTPIIMMSALNNQPLLEAAFEAGANDFLTKPFSLSNLEEKIKKFGKNSENIKT